MTKKPFTPGPWQTNPETPYLAAQVRDDVGRILADVYGEFKETRKANARLMAASPDGYSLAEHIEAMANDAYLLDILNGKQSPPRRKPSSGRRAVSNERASQDRN